MSSWTEPSIHVDHVAAAESWVVAAETWFRADDDTEAIPAAQAAALIGHLHLALADEHRRRPAVTRREGVRIDYELTPKADQVLRERYPR